jgi:hypothetical protein
MAFRRSTPTSALCPLRGLPPTLPAAAVGKALLPLHALSLSSLSAPHWLPPLTSPYRSTTPSASPPVSSRSPVWDRWQAERLALEVPILHRRHTLPPQSWPCTHST